MITMLGGLVGSPATPFDERIIVTHITIESMRHGVMVCRNGQLDPCSLCPASPALRLRLAMFVSLQTDLGSCHTRGGTWFALRGAARLLVRQYGGAPRARQVLGLPAH